MGPCCLQCTSLESTLAAVAVSFNVSRHLCPPQRIVDSIHRDLVHPAGTRLSRQRRRRRHHPWLGTIVLHCGDLGAGSPFCVLQIREKDTRKRRQLAGRSQPSSFPSGYRIFRAGRHVAVWPNATLRELGTGAPFPQAWYPSPFCCCCCLALVGKIYRGRWIPRGCPDSPTTAVPAPRSSTGGRGRPGDGRVRA